MEVIDIGLGDLEPLSLNINEGPKPSVNFGPGIELLMNDKKRASSGSGNVSIEMGDLDKLADELNELSGMTEPAAPSGETKTLGGFGNFFNFGGSSSSSAASSAKPVQDTDSGLGHATAESVGGSAKTWDGFSKMGDVPVGVTSSGPKMTDRERRRKKRAMIKKLEEWHEKGLIKHSSHFNMESNYEEVEDEYETILEEKRKKDGVKLQGWWFMTFINSLEYANTVFNPFDLNLDGWGEQVSEDIDSYEEIFAELHDKYKGGKLAPEISLLLRLGFSAAVVNITNKALSTATPGFNDVIRQSPELMKMFTNATVQSMGQQSPGFAMANNILHPEEQANMSFGPPPVPVNPKTAPPPPRPGMQYTPAASNRPDISMGRGAMFREEGVNVGGQAQYSQQQQQRPEMRGPQNVDINNILSGLKTRNVDIHEQPPMAPETNIVVDENDSMISISSMKDMQGTTLPKRSNRRGKPRSEKNAISLDI